ncbi:MAG: adenylate kinase [Candidatus Eutrophobiaceae bacterium]
MRIILLGPPGSGKGTQAKILGERFSIPQISTGDILRATAASNSPIGKELKRIMESGALVSDEIVLKIVQNRVQEEDCTNGFLLDGFPRTTQQAEGLESFGIGLDYIVELKVPDETIVARMEGRRIHPSSGRIYHIKYNPPKTEGIDDITGEPLIQRKDDRAEIVLNRLQVYHSETASLIRFYRARAEKNAVFYIEIDGTQSMEDINVTLVEKIVPTSQDQSH